MKLYHLTAIPPASVSLLQQGSFTAPRQQELVTANGSSLELYRLQHKQERLQPILRCDTFAQIRSISAFRLLGTRHDYLVVTSDSGSISVLSVDLATRSFIQVHCEPIGKTGCRRTVPGHLVTCEPRGRACMVAALEKQKLAYVLNRDAAENLTISSPLEANKSNTMIFSLVSLDVGFENPVFVALERSYDSNSTKSIVYYELQLGLNHIVRKLSAKVHSSSYLMFPVPGHTNGPGGVLVCSTGKVTYRSLFEEDEQGRLLSAVQAAGEDLDKHSCILEANLPYRDGTGPSQTMIVSGTVYHDKKENAFFFMLCTEYGDLIKAELSWTESLGATQLRLVYFDTLPSPATGLAIFPSGFMVASLEGGDMLLLWFKQVEIAEDHPAGGHSVCKIDIESNLKMAGEADQNADTMELDEAPNGVSGIRRASTSTGGPSSQQADSNLLFKMKNQLENLEVMGRVDSLGPVLSMCSTQGVESDQHGILCASGSGANGSICYLQRGLAFVHISDPKNLSGRPINVFTLKSSAESLYYRYIVLSFRSQTMVLVVDETDVKETTESGFELGQATLATGQIAEDSLLQVHRNGVRYIPSGKAEDATEWEPPAPSFIVAATCNSYQVVIALSSGSLVYFEADSENNSLLEVTTVPDALVPKGGDDSVTHGAGDEGFEPSLAILDVPPNRNKVSFFAVGDGASQQVRLYQIDANSTIKSLGLHLAPAPIESIALVDFGIIDVDNTVRLSKENQNTYEPLFSLIIGTKQGALVRLAVDAVTGNLSGKRSMFVGAGPVRVECVRIAGVPTCFAMGVKRWMIHPVGRRIKISPLNTDHMEHASSFSLQNSPDAIVTIAGSKLGVQCIDLLHVQEFCSSALLPAGMPDVSIPSAVSMGCSFQLSRTRTNGTPRRLIEVDQKSNHSSNNRGPKKRERKKMLYVTMETDHMVKLADRPDPSGDMTDNGMDQQRNGISRRKQRLLPSDMGSWVSRLLLLRRSSDQDADNDEELGSDDENGTERGSDPFQDMNPQAVHQLDSISLPHRNECMIDVISTSTLGVKGADPDALSYIVVSCAKNLAVSATSSTAGEDRKRMKELHGAATGSIHVYKVSKSTQKLVSVHETETEEPCFSLAPFRDMLLAGVGTTLRLYDLGKKQLLKKAEYKLAVQNRISCMTTAGGDRIFVGDIQESITVYKYGTMQHGWMHDGIERSNKNRGGGVFIPIASDTISRWITCVEVIDYSTIAVSDKFGNITILRLGKEISGVAEESNGIGNMEREAGVVGSRCTQNRLQVEASIHVGSTVSSLKMGSLCAMDRSNRLSGNEEDAIIYATMNGGIGVLSPLITRVDADWAILLEREMRRRYKSIVGRDHVSFRSNFYPVKNVVDGDLCEMFMSLSWEEKKDCCSTIGRSLDDVVRKLEELRETIL